MEGPALGGDPGRLDQRAAAGHAACSQGGMDQQSIYRRTLYYAAEALGGPRRLAAFFQVPEEKVAAWLSGGESPPLEVFLDSLDVIAQGPYRPLPRPLRRSAMREPVAEK